MSWFESEYFAPSDGEKILFHLRHCVRSSWEVGRYNREDKKVYNHYAGRAYITYNWDDIDYWYKVPVVPGTKHKKVRHETKIQDGAR